MASIVVGLAYFCARSNEHCNGNADAIQLEDSKHQLIILCPRTVVLAVLIKSNRQLNEFKKRQESLKASVLSNMVSKNQRIGKIYCALTRQQAIETDS